MNVQAHMSRVALPTTDYATDSKSIIDQCIRILQVERSSCRETRI